MVEFSKNDRKPRIQNINLDFNEGILYYISQNNYLFIKKNKETGIHDLKMIIDNGVVTLPSYIKMKKILNFEAYEQESIYVIAYINEIDELRLLVAKSTNILYSRVIQDFKLTLNSESLNINIFSNGE